MYIYIYIMCRMRGRKPLTMLLTNASVVLRAPKPIPGATVC